MCLPTNPLRLRHASILLSLLVLVACGGGGGSTEAVIPAPPPAPPEVVRGPFTFQAAALVIGQPDPAAGEPNQGYSEPRAATLLRPSAIAFTPDGGLLVADSGNNRVLLFESLGTAHGQDAAGVLGQLDFNQAGASVSRDGLNNPSGIAVGRRHMAVVDFLANRVLIYDRIPAIGEAMPTPVAVIGQPDFESFQVDCSALGLMIPISVVITPDERLIVVDTWNHRVLVWDDIPASQDEVRHPDRVIGQRFLNRCIPNDDDEDGLADVEEGTGRSVASARTLRLPVHAWSDGRRLVVADAGNHRVLIWRDFPTSDFQAADIVLGHESFTNLAPNSEQDGQAMPGPSARTLSDPGGVHSDGTSLAVADAANNRVLVWNVFPDRNGQRADVVLGHPGFEQSASDDDGDGYPDRPSARILFFPNRVLLTEHVLLVSDTLHHRVLVFRR